MYESHDIPDSEIILLNGSDPAEPGAATAEDEPLNFAERLAARFGAWAGAVADQWNLPSGPFFASDGRYAAQPEALEPPIAEA